MQIQIRYDSFDQFFRLNKENFQKVQEARSRLKSPQELGLSGNAIIESERLAYHFLNLRNLVSDLLFCVGASVLDAKHDIKNQTALAYREIKGAQGERKIQVEAHPKVIEATKKFNDLNDLKDYLQNKYSDFESNHYYYRKVSEGNS